MILKEFRVKTELCEAAERLDDEPDVVSAFHQLQSLHQQWREIGPWPEKTERKFGCASKRHRQK